MSIDIAGLAFGYPGHPVGSDVSLSVAPGEVLCLLGPNGSGKTTLFKTTLGLLPPLKGRIAVDGETTERWSRRRTAQHLAYVPQQHDAYFPFTVMEVVLMGRGAYVAAFATPGRHDREVAERTLRELHLLHLRLHRWGILIGSLLLRSGIDPAATLLIVTMVEGWRSGVVVAQRRHMWWVRMRNRVAT